MPLSEFQMNLVKYRVFMRKAELLQFFTPYSRGLWNGFEHISSVATVNAYYNQASNTMVVPIGMLQPPLFWNRPKSLTFGAFGIVVGERASVQICTRSFINTYRARKKGLYVVARNIFLLLLNSSAWPFLGPA